MTDKQELLDLQDKARRAGRICNLVIERDSIVAVFYEGRMMDPLSFAELERTKLAWWQKKTTPLS